MQLEPTTIGEIGASGNEGCDKPSVRWLFLDVISSKLAHAVVVTLVIPCSSAGSVGDASALLTPSNFEAAIRHFSEKWNDGMPLVGGGIEIHLKPGLVVTDQDIALLARWLHQTKQLPPLGQLLPLLDHECMGCRVFCHHCLRWTFTGLPNYSPYFPPNSQKEVLGQIRQGIQRQIDLDAKRGPK